MKRRNKPNPIFGLRSLLWILSLIIKQVFAEILYYFEKKEKKRVPQAIPI